MHSSSIVDLGPIRRVSAFHVFVALALGVLPLLVGAYGCATVLSVPDRVTLICHRVSEEIACDEIRWWEQGAGWKSEIAARHRGKRAAIKHFRVGGSTAKDCVAFETSTACGGNARANVEALEALADGGRTELDATRSETFGLVMAFGSLTGLLLFPWLIWMSVLLGRATRVRVVVAPTHLDVAEKWAGVFARSPRVIRRGRDEAVLVGLKSRGGRGDLPTWQLTYDATTDDGRRTSEGLLALKTIVKPVELDHAAERLRAVLASCPI